MAHLIFYLTLFMCSIVDHGAATAAALPADGEDPGEQLFALPFAKLFLSGHGEVWAGLIAHHIEPAPRFTRYRTPPPNTSPERLDR